MTLFSRSIPLLLSALFLVAAWLMLRNVALLFWAPALYLVILIALTQLTAHDDIRTGGFWLLVLAPFLLAAACFAFLAILSHPVWKVAVSASVAVLLFWFYQNVFQFTYEQDRYQPHAIENISTYMNVVAAFFAVAALASLQLYVHVHQLFLLAGGIIVFFFFVLQMLWVNKLRIHEHLLYLAVLPYIFGQIFWAALWLPIDFFVVAMLVTLCYYAVTNLVRQHLLERLESALIQRYLVIAVVGIILILSTAQWT